MDSPCTGPAPRAVLDIVVRVPGQGTFALDISVTEPACPTNLQGAAAQVGSSAHKREGEKHRRYPARAGLPTLIPLVYEAGGRPGRAAEAWLRRVVGGDTATERSAAMAELRQGVATALQRGNAALLMAGGPPAGGWPWA